MLSDSFCITITLKSFSLIQAGVAPSASSTSSKAPQKPPTTETPDLGTKATPPPPPKEPEKPGSPSGTDDPPPRPILSTSRSEKTGPGTASFFKTGGRPVKGQGIGGTMGTKEVSGDKPDPLAGSSAPQQGRGEESGRSPSPKQVFVSFVACSSSPKIYRVNNFFICSRTAVVTMDCT